MKNKYGIGDVFLLPYEVTEVRVIDGMAGVRYTLERNGTVVNLWETALEKINADVETLLRETTLDKHDKKNDIEDRDETEQSNGNDPCDGSKRN